MWDKFRRCHGPPRATVGHSFPSVEYVVGNCGWDKWLHTSHPCQFPRSLHRMKATLFCKYTLDYISNLNNLWNVLLSIWLLLSKVPFCCKWWGSKWRIRPVVTTQLGPQTRLKVLFSWNQNGCWYANACDKSWRWPHLLVVFRLCLRLCLRLDWEFDLHSLPNDMDI